MPPAPVSPDRLLALSSALAPLRGCARSGADEVLGLYPEVGGRAPQASVEACLDQVAELLRVLDSATSELADQLRIVATPFSDTGTSDIGTSNRAALGDARWRLR